MKALTHPLSFIVLCIFYSSLSIALQRPVQLAWLVLWAWLLAWREGPAALWQRFCGLKKMLWLLLSVSIIQLIFRRGGNVIFALGPCKIYSDAANYSLMISLRLMVIYFCARSLTKLDFSDYRSAFSKIHLPEELSFMISYMVHLIPELGARFKEQMAELQQRGIRLQKMKTKAKLTIYKILALSSLAEIILQSGQQAIALELRGFRSSGKRSSLHILSFGPWDLAILIVLLAQGLILLIIL
ncbi:MAG: energy-coupling factor transporter transmembrane protein EcfT [Candidatus Cloacimonetes bacterium]|jgi:energy-coupling factor transport system permease protein|nr:energy-coupling factor transporter transmembrane protein EcfT [Candidatus Cloacimonadota bacterium]MCB5287286.1 energy-coupling factor transporter transmembrane protein EcfT [Candidatus Cloacimonadota bacterium]MCK9184572.1 energy-coupling factor transporter transmembrane protein EcfT [Candidatus Cloacimonadota bacterium]MCK9585082.1 energy-coupling factor transporter transmembrane protein EcfT [Candidatus Cloacimonadota bacterium]MDY0229608.1 energy-coupling factor transporter transmembrane